MLIEVLKGHLRGFVWVAAGQEVDVADDIARKLIDAGHARKATPAGRLERATAPRPAVETPERRGPVLPRRKEG